MTEPPKKRDDGQRTISASRRNQKAMRRITRAEIQDELRNRGITQAALAKAAGIDPSTVSHYIAGRWKSRYFTGLLSSLLGENIEIIADKQHKIRRPTKEVMELRQKLFTPAPKTEGAVEEPENV